MQLQKRTKNKTNTTLSDQNQKMLGKRRIHITEHGIKKTAKEDIKKHNTKLAKHI